MSLIKLQGNASGTGAFTIAAPNSNTDRTLTLPDATGTVTVAPAGAVNFTAAPSGAMTLDASGNLGLGTTSPNEKVTIASSNSASYVQICDSSTGTTSGDGLFLGSFNGAAELKTKENNILAFGTNNTERARIDASGNLLVGMTSVVDAGRMNLSFDNATQRGVVTTSNQTAASDHFLFRNPNGQVGSIRTTNSTTAYNTSSDYRLKENVQPMTGALDTITQLKPVTYTWKVDGLPGQGFIAHELQAVVPDCVTGEKDAVDEEGNPMYQGVDTSFLVATLTKAIQELKAELDAAKARIAALEGATE